MAEINGTHINQDGNLGVTALQAGLAPCIACGTLHKWPTDDSCRRCGGVVRSRKRFSLQRTWAFLLVGILAYIPANTMPIMDTLSITGDTSDTIMTGVLALLADGGYFVAFIVFVASVCIPVIKFVVIGGLALSLHFHWAMSESTRQHLHVITEFIGRWSMIDVFVVAVLAALIQLGAVIKVVPGPGINWFALSVVFTMLSATSLDARLIWDGRSDVS